MLSIDEIKKIKYPYELFTDDIEDIKNKYVELMKIYHPDLNGKGNDYIEITKNINSLYKEAEENIIKGVWSQPGFIKLKCTNGKYYKMNFRISHTFELGKMYIGNDLVLYLIDEKYERMALNAINKINSIKYTNDDMKKEFNKYLPQVKESFRMISGEIGIVVIKDEDSVLLKDLLIYCKGKISLNEMNYIMNSLYSIVCFINYNGLTHNGITVDSCFISIKNHYVSLLGGWWYAVKSGKALLDIPKEISSMLSYKCNQSSKANSILDLESIKLIGRILLCNNTDTILSSGINIDSNLMIWLEENSTDNPFNEYIKWTSISPKMKDKNYIRFNIDKDDLYKNIGGN